MHSCKFMTDVSIKLHFIMTGGNPMWNYNSVYWNTVQTAAYDNY